MQVVKEAIENKNELEKISVKFVFMLYFSMRTKRSEIDLTGEAKAWLDYLDGLDSRDIVPPSHLKKVLIWIEKVLEKETENKI